jgi:hypothetical protein
MEFNYSAPAELFVASKKAARARGSNIVAPQQQQRRSASPSRDFRQLNRSALGSRLAMIGLVATKFVVYTTTATIRFADCLHRIEPNFSG